jgi:hypothetical protein
MGSERAPKPKPPRCCSPSLLSPRRGKVLTIGLSPFVAPQTIHSYPGDFRAYKALIAAQYNGVTLVRGRNGGPGAAREARYESLPRGGKPRGGPTRRPSVCPHGRGVPAPGPLLVRLTDADT